MHPLLDQAFPILASLFVGIGLAAAAGLRVFVPLLLSGLVVRFGLLPLSPEAVQSAAWLASTPALVCFGVATLAEVLAYKVPFVDHVLDVVGAPGAAIAGAVLASTFFTEIDTQWLRYSLAIVAGAGAATTVHAGTAAARIVSTKTTAGVANPVFSAGELVMSAVTSILAFVLPILVVIALVVVVYVVWRRVSRLRSHRGPTPKLPDSRSVL